MPLVLPRRSLNIDFVRDGQASGDNYATELSKLDGLLTFARASTATRFNATGVLETVASGQPRFDFDPVTLACKGLLIEEARTNLATRSEDLSHADWNLPGGVTRTANYATSPAGTNTATRIQGTASGWGADRNNITVVNGTTYTFSIWLKSNTGASQSVRLRNVAGAGTADIVVTTSWQRFTAVAVANSTTGWAGVIRDTADSTADILAWGAQLEAGAFATSYIPTTSAAVTRAADQVVASSLTPWLSTAEGTVAVDFTARKGAQEPLIVTLGAAAYLYLGDLNATQGNPNANGFGLAAAAYTYGDLAKWAVSYSTTGNRRAHSLNGSTVATSAGAPPTIDRLRLGSYTGSDNVLNGYIRRLVVLPYAVSDTLLKALTT